MKHLFFCLFLLLIIFHSYSQGEYLPGYYITNSGDTITGYILNEGDIGNSTKCEFRKSADGHTETFKPGEIQAYNISGFRYYQSMELPVEGQKYLVFAEYLVDGIADFYYFRDIIGNHFYIQVSENDIVELPGKKDKILTDKYGGKKVFTTHEYRGVIKYFMKDQENLFPEIDRLSLKRKDVIDLAKNYHDLACTDDSECLIYSTNLKKNKSGLALSAAYTRTYLTTSMPYNVNSYQDVPGTELSLNLNWYSTLPLLNSHLMVLPGIHLTIYNSNEVVDRTESLSYISEKNLSIQYIWIGPELEFRYNLFPDRKINPYFTGKAFYDLAINQDISLIETLTLNSTSEVTAQSKTPPPINRNFVGLNFGLGSNIKLKGESNFGVSFHYLLKQDSTKINWIASVNGFIIVLAYYL